MKPHLSPTGKKKTPEDPSIDPGAIAALSMQLKKGRGLDRLL
jgi:hypothetical protein